MLIKRFRKPRPTKVESLVGRHSRVLGEFRFSDGLHIDGLIKGDVVSDKGKAATLTLSQNGTVEGHVRVPFVIISGVVKGDVYADDYVELGSTAKIEGDVYYGLIEMAMGAEVNGKLVRIIENSEPANKIQASHLNFEVEKA